ncbi:MerR family transcriptional regulator [Alicyclobacillus macrosporangiidus]|uniref:MerR family transcriptional regulator, glutamine synthetase repressor n=1 Tax=Alicyclobacillus macrosporangiidus TaxID=392015 RepID=A0A1I7IUU6_9BACL|nr:MerR family transcriptional regulator [Alicyclobacillus macrosporangiidus]SFU76714.1 MerR family transcriptional regulator, glutamine synthetase repressor [Alicyclobacillus macrosporangiidus]
MDLNTRKEMPVFSISVVQKLTGLSARQIRYYEQHGLVKPARSQGNQRLFSFLDVERLLQVRELLDSGMNMAGVRAYFEKNKHQLPGRQAEPSDKELFRWLESQVLEPSSRGAESEFQGDLSRLLRRRP